VANNDSDNKRIIRTGYYPELTPTAVLVGYVLGALITISIGYACLILGFSMINRGSCLQSFIASGCNLAVLILNPKGLSVCSTTYSMLFFISSNVTVPWTVT